ncbi:MAG: hypothetical protein E7517_07340 [Ruminococcaceae bacterium]|nr:hypothetical protein [Oscillospiraceae bacterium]
MEIFCRKQAGEAGQLEYKMVESKSQQGELGAISVYGLRIKYCARDDFSYYSVPDLSQKPQVILQIIKYLFDRSVMPEQAGESIEAFLESN